MVELSVYFPKYVAIDNPRLWCIQFFCGCGTAIVVIVSLVWTKVGYVQQVLPESLVAPWVVVPNITMMNTSNMYWGSDANARLLQTRANSGIFNYKPQGYDYVFENPQVAIPCNGLKETASDISCVSPGETYKVFKAETIENVYLEDSVFVPTSYNEEFFSPGKTAANCPFKTDSATGEKQCKRTGSWLVPGVEDFEIRFRHKYGVIPPESWWARVTNRDRRIKGRLQVMVVNKEDEDFFQFVEDEVVAVPMSSLLWLAGIELDQTLPDGAAGTIFPQNDHTNSNASATPRVTGAEITIEMDYINEFAPKLGPLCYVRVTGVPTWMGMAENQIIKRDGTMRTRTYNGIRVRFIRKGRIEYFNSGALVSSVTTFIVWTRIPGLLVFYFAVFCLGTLSKIYTRYLYEDLNLVNEFNGVSARLLKRAHGFNDLHDLVDADGTRAISYQEARRRMYHILEGKKELDENEKDYFVSFFFSQTASKIGDREDLAILLSDYLKAVSSEEHLQYNEIMSFVDAEGHKMGLLEKLFMDEDLKKFLNSSNHYAEAVAQRDAALEAVEGNRPSTIGVSNTGSNAGLVINTSSSTGVMAVGRSGSNESLGKVSSLAKQATFFRDRASAQQVNAKMDRLGKELSLCRQKRDGLQERQSNYLHYLAHLQEKVLELQGFL